MRRTWSVWSLAVAAAAAVVAAVVGRSYAQETFRCPSDGHFPDENDCTRYYHCANGRSNPGFCPSGLFWVAGKEQCDWPEHSDCKFTAEKAQKLLKDNPVKVYLTFDDGPNTGTEQVLDALKKYGVRATFFINSENFGPDPKVPEQPELNARSLLRIVSEGHVLADHSYDHMFHNSDGPKNAYMDVQNDLAYFGRGNSDPVLSILVSAGARDDILAYVNYTMSYFVRMPYTNNWRVTSRTGRSIKHDCFPCTIPARSGSNGIEIANILHGTGAQVIGWDLEWNMNFNSNRLRYGGEKMFLRLGTGQHAKSKGKVVLLAHDKAFRPNEIAGTKNDQLELEAFLERATQAGYTFRTIETYLED